MAKCVEDHVLVEIAQALENIKGSKNAKHVHKIKVALGLYQPTPKELYDFLRRELKDGRRIPAIKQLRAYGNYQLRDAKTLVDDMRNLTAVQFEKRLKTMPKYQASL